MNSRLGIKIRNTLLKLGLASSVFVSGIAPVYAQTGTMSLSDVPLFLLESVPPNLAISFDDSGSMALAYIPDGIGGRVTQIPGKSVYYNKMYYDPNVDYRPGLTSAGLSLGEADFNAALTNIYNYVPAHGGRPAVVNLSQRFRPLRSVRSTSTSYASNTSEPAYYYNRDDSRPGCNGTDLDTDCYVKVVVSETSGAARPRPEFNYAVSRDERTNFANWYQYYSYRTLAGKTVLSRAFSPENISSSIRVGRQTINRRGIKSGNPGSGITGGNPYVAALTPSERANFYTWLYRLPAYGGTPLPAAMLEAGRYFSTSGTNSPYGVDPGTSGTPQLSCRLNAHIMLSDGVYWGSGSSSHLRDQNATTLPDGKSYNPNSGDHHIYGQYDSNLINLADIAFHYWASDLSPLENNVAPYYPSASGDANKDYWNPKNDPATWQHMVSYNIAFGIAGQIPLNSTTYNALLNGDPFVNDNGATQTGWTNTLYNNLGKVDDMYHSAINGRGEFFSASKPDELVESLVSVMNAIADRESSAASVDLNSSSISSGVGVYQARFFTDNWSGDLQARPISDGSNTNACNSNPIGSICPTTWSASEENTVTSMFPGGSDNRIIFSSQPGNSLGNRGIRFQWGQLNNLQKALIRQSDNDTIAQNRLKWLRGSAEHEELNDGPFRTRTASRVGAIVHSSPEYVGNGFDASGDFDVRYPDDLEIGGISHADFLCSNATDTNNDGRIDSCTSGIRNTRTPIAYVGGNDGMMHAYDARLDHPNGGKELFSFVPNAVYKNLHRLSKPTFKTGAYVDGALDSADVFYGGQWHTALVGGLRTGGQAYYSLDVTQGGIPTETRANARRLVKWEFGDVNTSGLPLGSLGANGDRDMGYTFGAPHIVKVNYRGSGNNTGRWVAIFGNGYNATEQDGMASLTGNAVIYVVDIETGLLIKKFDTGVGTPLKPNGISGIAPILNDTDLTADYIYAGDLYGNLWKFDISSPNLANWQSAYSAGVSPEPLFQAKIGTTIQPIQSTPVVSRHPQYGNLVYFGTGKYLEETDNDTDDQQSFYAVWDRDQCSNSGSGFFQTACRDLDPTVAKNFVAGDGGVTRTMLNRQEVTINTNGIRETSDNPASQPGSINISNRGWYLDFPTGEGERAIGKALLRGEIVVFTTLEPDDDICASGGSSWIYALDRLDGGPPPQQVFDHNGDGVVDASDYNNGVSSASHVDAVISDPTYADGGDGNDYIIYGSSDLGGAGGGVESAATPDTTVDGRVQWRQLN